MHRNRNAKRLTLCSETLLSLTDLRAVRGAAGLTTPQLSCIQICQPATINVACATAGVVCNPPISVFC